MWNHVLATVIGINVLLSGSAGLSEADPVEVPVEAPVLVAEPAAVEMVNMPSEMAGMAEWAVDLFDQAGLELPPLRFVHHGGATEPCRGRAGLHHSVDGVSVIELCATEASFPNQVMILHESAHAWVDHQLTPERKDEFQDLRGWEHWRDYDAAAWHENGTEQAAEIMVWGLIDQPIRMIRIGQASCDELETGYVTLTEELPLNGFRDHC